MTLPFQFFDGAGDEHEPKLLEGLRYRQSLIGPADENALIARVRELPFREFDFHGYKGKRRVVSFGWQYDFSDRQLRKADDIPEFLIPVRALAASFAVMEPVKLQHVLVTEYGPGVGIGWHRDKAVFGQVVGISLLAPCVLRFRRKVDGNVSRDRSLRLSEPVNVNSKAESVKAKGKPERVKVKRHWERVNVFAEPRSAYLLTGPARSEWEHSILRVDAQRYSITFRNMRED